MMSSPVGYNGYLTTKLPSCRAENFAQVTVCIPVISFPNFLLIFRVSDVK